MFDGMPIGVGIVDGEGVAFFADKGTIGACVSFSSLSEYEGPTSIKYLSGPVRVAYTATPDGTGLWALVKTSHSVTSLKVVTGSVPVAIHRLKDGFYLLYTPEAFARPWRLLMNHKPVVLGEVVGFNGQGLEVGSDELFSCWFSPLDAGGQNGFAEAAPTCGMT
jgi:hypothetical protein